MGTFEAAYSRVDQFFDRQNRLIALDGPRGVLLAQYLARDIEPSPERMEFLCYYPDNYTPYRGSQVPRKVPADIKAIAVPIEFSTDGRQTVEAGMASTSMKNDTSTSAADYNVVTHGRTMIDANGMSIRPHSFEAHMDGAGMKLTGSGLSVNAPVNQTAPTNKGVTAESPAWSLIPKSVVTFFAADYLPNLAEMERTAYLIVQLTAIIKLVGELVDLVQDLND